MRRLLPSLVLALLYFVHTPAQAQDTIPPVINCPGNLAYTLPPGACEMPVFFNISATDNAGTPTIVQIDGTGYSSGDYFPRGTFTLVFMAVDSSLNTDTCSFTVTIHNYPTQTQGLACDPNLHISMPATCEMWLTPDMVLEGDYGCYEDFVVDVNNTGSNYIGYYYVGETISYTVTNTTTGNSCWGQALIEDKSGPLISHCDSVTINCLEDPQPAHLGGAVPTPDFLDCNPFDTVWVDMVSQGACTGTTYSQIMRIWSATDSLGNNSSCTQTITIERIPLDSLEVFCAPDTIIECIPGSQPDFSPASTGYPYVIIDSLRYDITDGPNSLCNISASYSDQVIPVCGASVRIVRTWTILDWCQDINMSTNPYVCKQIITYQDKTPPSVTLPDDLTASANLPGCRARPTLPAATVEDCSSWSVVVITPVGPISGNGGKVPAPGLPIGPNKIIYKVTDACGNSTADTLVVNVIDNVKPTAVCDKHTVVALDNEGYGFAYAETFDDGSADNCCIKNFKVAKMTDACGNPDNLVFDDYVDFCCEEVGQTVMVILRVNDCHGNFNECMVEVEVQDKAGPSITCPPDITIFCGTDHNNLAITGNVVTDPAQQGPNDGLAMDNCGGMITVVHSDEGTVDCGQGLVYRTFKVSDPAGLMAFCVQRITVQNNSPFTGSNIVFPPDTSIIGCASSTLPANTGQPQLPPPSPCYMLVTAFSDQVFNSIPGACQKIYRTWTVIDMCQYNPNDPNSPGQWKHTQVITVTDNTPPQVTSCENRTFCNFKSDCGPIAPDLSITATDACTPDSLLFYSWSVDLNRDGSIDAQGTGQNTTNPYPIGQHRIHYTIVDACGNFSSCSFDFAIEDCKKPTVFCNGGLVVSIMQTGMISVNVNQFEQGSSYDNCTPRSLLRFSFSPDVNDTVRTYTCDDVGTVLVQVWATDASNNQDYCQTSLTIQDNMTACADTMVVVGGQIASEANKGLEGVNVELNGDMNSVVYTDQTGKFHFPNVPVGYDYTISPFLNDDPVNGVTTFDIVLLQRHVLGIQPLDSPYKIIAADVNNSGSVTIGDAVDLRKVVLHIIPNFPNNTSWRFVDAQWTFPDPANPFEPPFPQICNINDLSANPPAVDFVAVKVGDLNYTATTSKFDRQPGDRTLDHDLSLHAPLLSFGKGETIEVPVSVNMQDLLGVQFTLEVDPDLYLVEAIEPGPETDASNFGTVLLDQGAITFSWNRLAAERNDAPSVLLTLRLRTLQAGNTASGLAISSRFTAAEAYNQSGELLRPSLGFMMENGKDAVGMGFELNQNVPNPFAGETVIGFHLPVPSSATLRIFDAAGRQLTAVQGTYGQGYHEVRLPADVFNGEGVYFYRLETPQFTATKKMTMIE